MAATDGFWAKFRHWRRRRPFWGCLFFLLAGLEILYTANMDLGNLQIHMGQQGFLSYVVPVVLILCAVLCAITPAQRLFYGIVGVLTALYSFIGVNLGGFIVGMILGIVGGALVISWGPPRSKPGDQIAGPPAGEPTDHQEDGPVDVGDDIFNENWPAETPTEQIEVAGHDDRPHDQQPIRPAGQAAQPEPPQAEKPRATGLQRLARNPRAMALALIPVAVTAIVVVAGSNLPASADETCPDGLPSATATTTTAAAAAAAVKKATTAKTTAPKTAKTTKAGSTSARTTTSATPSPSASSESNTVVSGIKGVIDGIGNLLGIGDDSSASPSTSPSPSASTTPGADPTTTSPATGTSSASSASADPTKTTTPAAATTTASGDVIPCLGPRIYGKVAGADDIPQVAQKPGVMQVDSLTMYNSTYDGVVNMPTTGGGSFKALKFSMDKAVNKPFKLTIAEKNGSQTVISSKELTTTGTVKFYTPEFKGKLFGLIPVTFTPDSPPPLTLPILWFTDVTIQLAYVRCDTLTGDPLVIQN
ncbi:DUF6114 domain-containing protein [Actinoplanes subtropicus]|uniref:DUF6114 domain-containing protein n=1 Tax=Actinoplanes subtropicus TaxID=543632 RepID=UPI0004C3C62F|nr:DUF6114 domain-containing protein [Actinoplanes subtropicus]